MSKLPTLLCVDDEPLVLNSLERLLEDDYDVLKATSGAAALTLLTQNKVDVLISDQRMPGMSGVELLERARAASPNTMRILLTGYADLEAVRAAVNHGEVFRYLTKPWSNAVLKETITQCVRAAKDSANDAQFLGPQSSAQPTQELPAGAIMLLDPDPQVAHLVSATVTPKYRFHHARSLADAVAALDSDPEIWLLMTEVRIDGQEVVDILNVLKQLNPRLMAAALTSVHDATMVIRLINEGQILRFVAKPLDSERVLATTVLARTRYQNVLLRNSLQGRFAVQSSPKANELLMKIRSGALQTAPAPQGSEPANVGFFQKVFALFKR